MKKIKLLIVIVVAMMAFSLNTNAQNVDIENYNPNPAGFTVDYCGLQLFVPGAVGGVPGSVAGINPCPLTPPCSINVRWCGAPCIGCGFTVNFPSCPTAGVAYDSGLFTVSTGCAVTSLRFRIRIDPSGNVVINIYP